MKRLTKIFSIIVLSFILFALVACNNSNNNVDNPEPQPEEHVCQHVCPECGKCLDSNCTNPLCAEKCQGHEAEHVCNHKCPECGKCLDSECTDPACAEKCQGHEGTHTCAHKCPECGKCLDPECSDPACADKCQGHVKNTITYDLDGGKASNLVSEFVDCNKVALPTPTKDGCKFLGWYEGETKVTKLENKNYVLVAKWEEIEEIDYAGFVKLDMSSDTIKQEVTVKTFIDGDTTHFYVPTSLIETGVLKARYLGINTPESTGKIEEYGKTASNFTKEKLSSAVSIIIESDDANLNADSTGGRYLVWVWYKTSSDADYRNLNIEILQNGLAIASNSANNRYGDYCVAAISQAKTLKYNIYSGQKDPNFYYGEAKEITLKELRSNIAEYNGVKVAFEAVVVKDYSQTVYVEEYDEELDMYFGMQVYYGFSAAADVLNILSVGNRVRIVGSVQYYEAGGTYQVSGLTYRAMKPKDAGNVQKIGEGYEASFNKVTAAQFLSKVTVEDEAEQTSKQFDYAELAMSSSISMDNLFVKKVYTTSNEDSSSYGAMTLTCEVDGKTISVRTVVLYDSNGQLITEAAFLNKTIDVKGIVDYFDGSYQIKLYSMSDVTFK